MNEALCPECSHIHLVNEGEKLRKCSECDWVIGDHPNPAPKSRNARQEFRIPAEHKAALAKISGELTHAGETNITVSDILNALVEGFVNAPEEVRAVMFHYSDRPAHEQITLALHMRGIKLNKILSMSKKLNAR